MMGRGANDADRIPTANPDPASNTGYAEPKPLNKEQAHIPGAKQPPDKEEGGLEHEPDPKT